MTALGFALVAANSSGLMPATVNPIVASKPEIQVVEMKDLKAARQLTAEEYVRSYFSDIPVMIEVSRCESRFRQYDKNGNVLRGEQNDADLGVMQINEYYHDYDSDKLGYDIMTIEGNVSYARYLFEKSGLQPWKSSSPCWKKTLAYQEYQESLTSELAINK